MQTLQDSVNEKHYCVIEIRVEQMQKLRLYDMGFYAGSVVTPLYECWGGGTKVYEVKQTLIALRQKDAKNIWVREMREYEQKQ